MKRKELFFIVCFLLVFILNACVNKSDKAQNNKPSTIEYMLENQNRTYTGYLSKFDTLLTQHFPKSLDTTNLQVLRGSLNGVDMDYLEVTNRVNDKSISQKYNRENIGSYVGNDPCVLAYHRFESWKEYPASRFRQCLIGKYPIPDFRGNKYRDMGTESRLPEDFIIYVLDSKPENDIPDSLIVGNSNLLEKWEKGFSRGVAISEQQQIIIYWLLVW